MLNLLPLSNIGNKGLNTDISPWSLPVEFITSGLNFRVHSNRLESSSGYEDWSTAPALFNPGFNMHIGSTSGNFWAVLGQEAYVFNGTAWADISSVSGYGSVGVDDGLKWTGCMLGQIPVFNNPQAQPEYWSPISVGTPLQPLPFDGSNTWQDKGFSFEVIRSHKNFLFALNLHDGVSEIPDGYRWSHPADINGIPYTWDETDPTALAGLASLGGDGGRIIDGRSLRDSFCIYSETSIDILDYTGDEFVWRRRELSATVGLLSKQCIIEIKGTHFFLADGDIVKNDGNSITSIIHDRIRRRLVDNMHSEFYSRSFAVRNNAHKEIWFCVPEGVSEYPNTAYIYNWKDDSWAVRALPANLSFANYGPVTEGGQTWDTWLGTWDTQTLPWGSQKNTPLEDTLVGVDTATSSLMIIDPQDQSIATVSTARIERTDYPLEGMRQVNSVVSVYPHMTGTEPVQISIGSQDSAGAPVRWEPAVSFTPGVDRKVDVRTTGELLAWRIEGLRWAISGMDIEYARAGLR